MWRLWGPLADAFVLALVAASASGAGAARPTRSVRDFGAVGDGEADDTAAFQRAVDAGVGDVFVPRGVYRLTKPVVVELDKTGWTSLAGTGAARGCGV